MISDEYGIYVTPNLRYALRYGHYIHKVFVNIKSPLVVRDKSEISPKDLTKQDVERLQDDGYDSIVSTNSDIQNASEIVLFSPEQVHVFDIKRIG
jgi:hypothetical protein